MNHLRDLYQDVILEHNHNPRNFKPLENCSCTAHGDNPICGDSYDVFVQLHGDLIEKVTFTGSGCAISKAAASMMTSKVKGKTVKEAQNLITAFRHLMTDELTDDEQKLLGHLEIFQGVAKLPQRIKCAVLPWHTLAAALSGESLATSE